MHRRKGGQIDRRSREDVPSFRVPPLRDETVSQRKAYRHGSGMLRAVRPLADRDGAAERGDGIVEFSFARLRLAERLPHGSGAIDFRPGA